MTPPPTMAAFALMLTAPFAAPEVTPPVVAPPAAEAAPAAAPDVAADPMRETLAALKAASDRIERFSTPLIYSIEDDLEGALTERFGQLLYERRTEDEGGPRFAAAIRSRVVDDRVEEQDLTYAFEGRWIAEIDHRQKMFTKKAMAPAGQQFDPFALGAGVVIVPIGQDPDRVLGQFEVSPIGPPTGQFRRVGTEAAGGSEGLVGLKLVPRPGSEARQRLRSMWVWYDEASGIPVGMVVERDVKIETIELPRVDLAPTFTAEDLARFDISEPTDPDWSVTVDGGAPAPASAPAPEGGEAAPAGANPGVRSQPVG